MKLRIAFIIIVLVAIASFFAMRQRTSVPEIGTVESGEPSGSTQQNENATPVPQPKSAKDAEQKATREFLQTVQNDRSAMFNIPIRFYGKVVDEQEQPVSEATVHFKWNKLNATNGLETGTAETKTNPEGLFSFEGEKSNGLNVEVNKAGYYTVSGTSFFEYAQPFSGSFHVPDLNSPVVFHLRRKGQAATLITSENGMRPDWSVAVPLDGTPIRIDLLQKQIMDSGALEISQIKPDPKQWKQADEWTFQMKISDGGFVEHSDEFPFEAPEGGYEPIVKFYFQKIQPDWDTFLKKDFYIRFGNPPIYGRLHVETGIDQKGARLKFAINPDGSRNLESQ